MINLNRKKAAMFGLDARIALAIFGALSIISGAALYSAIQQAKVISIVTSLQEIAKAVESYMVDTGQDLPKYLTSPNTRQADKLISSTTPGWSGPYLTYVPILGAEYALNVDIQGGTSLHIYHCKGSFGDQTSTTSCPACDGSSECYSYIKMHNYSKVLLTELDQYIDNGDGFDSGKLLIQWADAGKTDGQLFYKIAPTISQ